MSLPLNDLISHAWRHGSERGGRTALDGLTIWTADAPTRPVPALFQPKFYLLLQGAKRMTIGGEIIEMRGGRCAIASVGLPFMSEVIEATAAIPYVGIELELDGRVIADLPVEEERGLEPVGAITFADVDAPLAEAIERFLRLLDTPADIPALARQYAREVWYRLLQGPLAPRLRQSRGTHSRFGQIRKAAEWIARHADEPLNVDWLAAYVGMSPTSFHRHFRAVTSDTPLAYRRQLRLLEARRRIVSGTRVTEAAYAVGYGSATQFSREYKRVFGNTPAADFPVATVARRRDDRPPIETS